MSNKILFFAGSARRDSFNKKLAHKAFALAKDRGADATFVDLKDYPMPIYDGDLEAESGLPDNAKKLKHVFIEHKGLFIASPEYNSSIPPLLKNCLDWVSRKESADEAGLRAYQGKIAALTSASPGGFGGMRALVPLRLMLSNIQVTVLPNQLSIPAANKVFDDQGELQDDALLQRLQGVVDALIDSVG